jgi:hypothetical protein
MSSRANELAQRFAAANEAIIDFVATMTDDEWVAACPREGRATAGRSNG